MYELTPAGGRNLDGEGAVSTSVAPDGGNPQAGLIFDAAGNLYGTTFGGGAYNLGTLFELTPAGGGNWTESVLHSFGNGTDGAVPRPA